jgi:hypothetical protein
MSDSDKQHEGYQNNQHTQDGVPPAWAQYPPPPGYYGYPPHMMHPGMQHQYMHPGMQHPHMQPGMQHPHMHPGMQHPHMQPGMQHPHMHPGFMPPPMPQAENDLQENDPMFEQAQAMLEGMMGEEFGMFKTLLGKMGMNDKEFWKGAMVGAAAALVFSNENVRSNLMNLLSNAGNMLKTGGTSVKDGAAQTTASVKQSATASSEIFCDTYQAGMDGFKDSVQRHSQPGEHPQAKQKDTAPESGTTSAPEAE